jgi:putative FmdB family regulatory protein
MPTYDYVCDACDHRFEEFQSMSEEALKKCPECKKLKLRRLFGGGAAILFKGSGFYETDYRSDSYKSAAKADQEKAASGNGKAESSSGAKKEKTSGSGGKSPKSET